MSDEWVLVPRKPTPEMLERAIYAQEPNQPLSGSGNANRLRRRADKIWIAMIYGAEHERRTQQECQDARQKAESKSGVPTTGQAK